ncbi:hypothetical protein BH11PLA2_BH11PLA2_37890 [soil metagenome]
MNEVDNAYREFFQREVPKSLPPLPLNHTATPVPQRTAGREFLMAASVAGLLGLGLWLSGTPNTANPKSGEPTKLLKNAEADGKKLLDAAKDLPMP